MINTNYGWSTLIQVILHFMGFWLLPHTPHLQHTTDILLFYLSTKHVLLCELDKRNVLIIKKEGNVHFTTPSTQFIYMVLHIWLRTTQIIRKITHCCLSGATLYDKQQENFLHADWMVLTVAFFPLCQLWSSGWNEKHALLVPIMCNLDVA